MRSHHDTQRAPRAPHPSHFLRLGGAGALAMTALLLALGAARPPIAAARHLVEVTPGRWVEVRGERNHQQRLVRRLPATWSADQKAAAARLGYPFFRLRELAAGVTTEVWTYPDRDLQLIFDARGRLIDSRLP